MELYTGADILAIRGDAFFGKGGGSRNTHQLRLSGMPSMVSLYVLVFEPILPI